MRMKFDVVMKQSWDYFWVRFIETWEIDAVLQTGSKYLNVGMHSDIYEWIWLKLDMMIDTTTLYILILA